ncbi:MAG: hypothetical protein ABJP33_05960 [Pseudoruegeria sp.]
MRGLIRSRILFSVLTILLGVSFANFKISLRNKLIEAESNILDQITELDRLSSHLDKLGKIAQPRDKFKIYQWENLADAELENVLQTWVFHELEKLNIAPQRVITNSIKGGSQPAHSKISFETEGDITKVLDLLNSIYMNEPLFIIENLAIRPTQFRAHKDGETLVALQLDLVAYGDEE